MSIATVLIVLLVLVLLGGAVPWQRYGTAVQQPPVAPGQPVQPAPPGYWHGYGFGPFVPGAIGLILAVIVILMVIGRI